MSMWWEDHNYEKCKHTGKRKLDDESAAKEIERIREKRGVALKSYKCPYCHALHLAKKKGK